MSLPTIQTGGGERVDYARVPHNPVIGAPGGTCGLCLKAKDDPIHRMNEWQVTSEQIVVHLPKHSSSRSTTAEVNATLMINGKQYEVNQYVRLRLEE